MKKLFFLLALVGFLSCEKAELSSFERVACITTEYANPGAAAPAFSKMSWTPSVAFDPKKQISSIDNDRIKILFKDIQLKDEFGIYDVDSSDIITQEFTDGKWATDYENYFTLTKTKSMDVVLVLDLSYSVNEDIGLIRTAATTFVDYLFSINPKAKVGVVGFSDNISSFSLVNNKKVIYAIIDNITSGNPKATKLYEAMNTGLDLLTPSKSTNICMVTLTDGNNNSWSTNSFRTDTVVLNRMKTMASTSKTNKFRSFTIGFNGSDPRGVNESTLKRLAVDGSYQSIEQPRQVNDIFRNVARKVSCVFDLCYSRNNSPIDPANPIPLRLLIRQKLQ
ncbi:MAG: vWA domain-containing protein [Saprospiraceae bacterium]